MLHIFTVVDVMTLVLTDADDRSVLSLKFLHTLYSTANGKMLTIFIMNSWLEEFYYVLLSIWIKEKGMK